MPVADSQKIESESEIHDESRRGVFSTEQLGSLATSIAPTEKLPDATTNSTQDGVSSTDTEAQSESNELSEKHFSAFTTNQKRVIIAAGSCIGFLSPLAGGIYFPALTSIAESLHVTDSQVNLTVMTFLVLQGIAPTFVAGVADSFGRRPAFIGCLVLFFVANLGLGLQNSYAALLGLRCLQSAGSSGTIVLANSMVGDLVTPAERGSYMAYSTIGSVLGPSLSPIIGGLIAYYLDWHWIFWFLLILGAFVLVGVVLFLPETCRKVVGDGSIPPPPLNWSLADFIRYRHRMKDGMPADRVETLPRPRFNVLQLVQSVFILVDPESFILLLGAGLSLASYYAIGTGVTASFKANYGFNEIQVSLMFLPVGVGSLLSSFSTGRLLDMNYRRHAKKLGITVNKKVKQDLVEFPIEKARMEVAMPFFCLSSVAIIAYGWTMDLRLNLAAPIVFLFLLGYGLVAAFQSTNVVLTDIWPGQVASAMAAGNLVRCELGAAASALIQPMTDAMGRGWTYTTLALILLASQPALVLLMSRGIAMRRTKAEKQQRKAEKELQR